MRVTVPIDLDGGQLVLDLPGLTRSEARLLLTVQQLTGETGYPPTVREIGRRLGWASTNFVQELIQNLTAKGWLRKRMDVTSTAGKSAPLTLRRCHAARSLVLARPLLWRREAAP